MAGSADKAARRDATMTSNALDPQSSPLADIRCPTPIYEFTLPRQVQQWPERKCWRPAESEK